MLNTNTSRSFRPTKLGAIILIISSVLFLLFTVLGVIVLVNDDTNQIDASIGRAYRIDAEPTTTYELKFTPSFSGTYEIRIDGAYATSLTKSSSGSNVSLYEENSSYDYSYSAYLSAGTTYILEIRTLTSSNSFRYYIYR